MSFTTPCFIRKNSKELRDKIYSIGNRNGTNLWDDEFNTLLAVDNDSFRCWDDEWDNSGALIRKGYIDCGTNSGLFLAIAAMRDDDDTHQWFTDGEHWILSDYYDFDNTKTIEDECMTDNVGCRSFCEEYGYHKATVSELITYFKNKEQ